MSFSVSNTERKSKTEIQGTETGGNGSVVGSNKGRPFFDFLARAGFDIFESFESEAILTYFMANLFATTLEDNLMKIRALVDSGNELALTKIKIDMPQHLKKKYGVNEPLPVLEDIDPQKIHCNEFKINKMDKDRKDFIEVMSNTYLDLGLRLNYKSLQKKIDDIEKVKREFAMLVEEEAKNKMLVRELRRQLRQIIVQNKTIMYDTDVIIDTLSRKIEDVSLTSEIEFRHVDKWELARTEQHMEVINQEEETFNKSIRYYRERSEKEQIVHSEIDSLTNIIIEDNLREIQKWMEKYEADMENIDLLIQKQRIEYSTMLEERIRLQEMFALHNKQIFDWNLFKEKRAEQLKYVNDMTRCAIAIQAWWRGILVRRALGPYKVKKKKKAPPKKF